jgi:hypothetical protein
LEPYGVSGTSPRFMAKSRFNRRRYDAARTGEGLSGRLRDEIDLDSLSVELLAVVEQTMQPNRRVTLASISLTL